MSRRRNADEVARLLREADRDLAKGLTVSDFCRKHGIAETTYIVGDSDTLPARSITIADAGNWSSRSIASRGWWPSCSWTKRCCRTSQKKKW